jgi:hypothetical protein
VLGEEEGSGRGEPGRGLTRKGPEVTVRFDFPLFGGLRRASWRERERESETGEEQCMQSLVRGGARGLARDQIRRVKVREKPSGESGGGRKSMRKVRTEP